MCAKFKNGVNSVSKCFSSGTAEGLGTVQSKNSAGGRRTDHHPPSLIPNPVIPGVLQHRARYHSLPDSVRMRAFPLSPSTTLAMPFLSPTALSVLELQWESPFWGPTRNMQGLSETQKFSSYISATTTTSWTSTRMKAKEGTRNRTLCMRMGKKQHCYSEKAHRTLVQSLITGHSLKWPRKYLQVPKWHGLTNALKNRINSEVLRRKKDRSALICKSNQQVELLTEPYKRDLSSFLDFLAL